MEIEFTEYGFGLTHAIYLVDIWHRELNGIAYTNHDAVKKDNIVFYENDEKYIHKLCLLYYQIYNQTITYNRILGRYIITLT